MKFNPRVLSIASYPATELAVRKKKLSDQGIKVFDFGTGDPIEPTANFIRQAVGENVPVISQYPTVKGLPQLRLAAQGYIKRRFGVHLDSEAEILPCTGGKEAIYNTAFLFVGPDTGKDVIIAPSPGYSVMERGAIMSGAHYYPFYLNEDNKFLMELSVLPSQVLERTAIAWINYPHNPSGKECDLAYLQRQVETARKYDILLCSDECYVDLYFGSAPPPSILQVATENVLAFHSCSKRSGMTAYRTGFIAGDKDILKTYAAFRDSLGVATPVYTQHAAIKAWGDDQHVAERREVFRHKRDIFLDFFTSQNFEYVASDSTFFFWLKAPKGMTGKEYANQLLEGGIVVTPGEFFGKNSADYYRVALVPPLEECKAAIDVWRKLG